MPRGTGAKSSGGNGRRGPDKIKRKRSCFRRPSKSASAAENPNPFTARNVSAGNEESSSSSPSSLPPQPSPSPASSPSPSDARHTFVKEYLHTLIKELKEQLRQEKGALYDHLKRGHTTIEPVNPVIACFTSGLNPEHFWKPALRCWLPKLWFPELDLKCPKCHQFGKHHKHGYASNPEARCVAGLRNDWYLFTSVLQCAFCRHRFYATHPDVLGNMHQAFSNPILLPFVLSESSGLDSDVAWMMPIIFNDGGTAESLHRMMSEGHAEQRDLLHAVYNAVCDFRLKKSVGLPDPPKFDRSQVDVSVPAASSLLSIYKRETLRYEKYMNLHMLTLSAESAKLDASHKMPKLICNVNGQRIFDTAVQVTNERSQIVAFYLCAGTGHDQIERPLAQWVQSRSLLNQKLPSSIGTDKCCDDEAFLTRLFKYEQHVGRRRLEPFTLSGGQRTCVIESIGNADSIAFGMLQRAHEAGRPLAAGVDSEWVTVRGQRRKVATVQVALEGDDAVYIFRLSKMGEMPRGLKDFLESTSIVKVGKSITIDKRHICNDYGLRVDGTESWIELGQFAYRRGAAPSSSSLAKLVQTILQQELPKPELIRQSNWEANELSSEQVMYAALDAHASLQVYLRLEATPDPTVRLAIPGSSRACNGAGIPVPGMAVELLAQGTHVVVARGRISQSQPAIWEQTKVTKGRIVVDVVEVLASAAEAKYPRNSKRTLSSFGYCPFSLLVDITSLRPTIQPQNPHNNDGSSLDVSSVSVGSAEGGERVKRVLQDIFHIMKRVKIRKTHPFYPVWVIALSDAFFVWNEDDEQRVINSLISRGENPLSWRVHRRGYFLDRVRRRIPPPGQLEERLNLVYKTCSGLTDHDGVPLFDDRAHAEFRKVLEHVRKGCCSDPDGDEYPFYTAVGEDGHGLTLYRCHRGTNSCEANHNVLKRKFGTMNAGVALTHCLMLWHILRTNIRAGESFGDGSPVLGHFRPWLVDFINMYATNVWGEPQLPQFSSALDWQWDELRPYCQMLHFGGECDPAHAGDPNPLLSDDKRYLAKCQGSTVPYLPVHTPEEADLYRKVLADYADRNRSTGKDFQALASLWNQRALSLWHQVNLNRRCSEQTNSWHDEGSDQDAHPNVFLKFAIHLRRYDEQFQAAVIDRESRREASSETSSLFDVLRGPNWRHPQYRECETGSEEDQDCRVQNHVYGTSQRVEPAHGDNQPDNESQGERDAERVQNTAASSDDCHDPEESPEGQCGPEQPPEGQHALGNPPQAPQVLPERPRELQASLQHSNVVHLPAIAFDSATPSVLSAGRPASSAKRSSASYSERRCHALKSRMVNHDDDLLCGKLGCSGLRGHHLCNNTDESTFLARKRCKAIKAARDVEKKRQKRADS